MLRSDFPGVPAYSREIADSWGDGADFRAFLTEGRQHPVRSAARITHWDALVAAVCNGYPCTLASNVGFTMRPGTDGFHRRRGSWPHQMCVVGICDDAGAAVGRHLEQLGRCAWPARRFRDRRSLAAGHAAHHPRRCRTDAPLW